MSGGRKIPTKHDCSSFQHLKLGGFCTSKLSAQRILRKPRQPWFYRLFLTIINYEKKAPTIITVTCKTCNTFHCAQRRYNTALQRDEKNTFREIKPRPYVTVRVCGALTVIIWLWCMRGLAVRSDGMLWMDIQRVRLITAERETIHPSTALLICPKLLIPYLLTEQIHSRSPLVLLEMCTHWLTEKKYQKSGMVITSFSQVNCKAASFWSNDKCNTIQKIAQKFQVKMQ